MKSWLLLLLFSMALLIKIDHMCLKVNEYKGFFVFDMEIINKNYYTKNDAER